MPTPDPIVPARRGRRARPALEALEGRDLPSLTPLLAASPKFRNAIAVAQANDLTPHEQVRERFSATFSGQFTQAQGRLTSQASQIFISGGGTSSAFIHGDAQIAFFIPKDPTQDVTGIANLIVKNATSSGNVLVLDLTGVPGTLDRSGRPTQFTWTVDNGSGGTFGGATGSGTLQVRYRPSGTSRPGVFSSGGADVLFRGQVATVGVFNVLRPVAHVIR